MDRKCDNCGHIEQRDYIKMHDGLLNGQPALICETCVLRYLIKLKIEERGIDPDSLVPVNVKTEPQDDIVQTEVTFTYDRGEESCRTS